MDIRERIANAKSPEEMEQYLLDLDSEFRFKCRRCGKCCKNQDIELSYCNNYYEDMILELLNTLVPFTAEGFISYRGEEGDLWCHVFAGGEWTERSGRICYDEPRPQFEESKQNLERLIEEIRRQVIYDDRPYEDRARDLLKAFEAHDPDGVLLALSGRRLHEHGVAAGIWQDGGESAHPDERE